ncbi:MAG: adenosylcobinamide-GDP ribazoletransferase [Bacillota bacterium]
MKDVLRAVAVAFSMYSALPMPKAEWNENNLRYAVAFLPLVGAVAALALYGLDALLRLIAAGPLLYAALLTVAPLLITGGIHMDGFCDTLDALSAHAEPERARAILKDPRAGAFAAVGSPALLLLQAGAWAELSSHAAALPLALLGFVFSRAFAAIAVLVFPKASETGLAARFSAPAPKKRLAGVLWALAALLFAGATLVYGIPGALAPLLAAALLFYLRRMSEKRFGGLTGDLAGFYICICETLWLLAVAVSAGALR